MNGRVITGTTEDINSPFVFAPRVASCAVGRLVAGGSTVNASIAAGAQAPASLPTADASSRTPSAGFGNYVAARAGSIETDGGF